MTQSFRVGQGFGRGDESIRRGGGAACRLTIAAGAVALLWAGSLAAQPAPAVAPPAQPEPAPDPGTVAADAGRAELETQIATLKGEIAALREQLARTEDAQAGGKKRDERIRLLETQLAELEARGAADESAPEPAATGALKLTPGAQAWLRAEARTKPDLGRTDQQNVRRVLQRTRLQLRAEQGPVTVFAQAQDAREWGFEASTISNESNTDLHQGYLELGGGTPCYSGFVRVGRQEITYGSQRLIGDLGWDPNARSFDALRVHGENKLFKVDAFLALLAPPRTFTIVDPVDPAVTETHRSTGSTVAAVQLAADLHQAFQPELYFLWDRARATPSDPSQERNVYSPGLRLSGDAVQGLEYDAEGYLQFGDVTGRDHFAWAFAAGVGYTYRQSELEPRARAGYSMASGEACEGAPGSGCAAPESREFFNFYPLNHAYYGVLDLFGWRNIRDLELGVGATPLAGLEANLTYHFFQLHEAAGRWSNAGGATVGDGDFTNARNTLGHELDVVVTYRPWEFLAVQPGYGVFVPAAAGKVLGGPGTQQFFYLMANATL
jgi:hypothetical protein